MCSIFIILVDRRAMKMSKIIEDLIDEYKKEWAIGIIKTGKLSYEEIAECLRLDIDEIKNLA